MRTLSITLLCLIGCAHQQPTRTVPVYDYERDFPDVKLDEPHNLDEPDYQSHWYTERELPGSGGAIKVWSNGDNLNAADLNANFAHIHNSMIGAHGARLVDSDVSATAALSSSKFSDYRMIPRAWGSVATGCTASCSLPAKQHVTSATVATSNHVEIVLDYTPTNASYVAIVSAENTAAASGISCNIVHQATTPHLGVYCMKQHDTAACTGAAAANCAMELMSTFPAFDFVVFDND